MKKSTFTLLSALLLACTLIFDVQPGISQKAKTLSDLNLVETLRTADGRLIDKITVPGIPPAIHREPVTAPTESAVMLSNMPGYDWSFGCSATAAAMIAGFYDNNGYPNSYTGPTNGGVAPMNNSSWGTVTINGEVRSLCPISATRQGLDGRATRGHVDDYWIAYGNSSDDPYITNGWTEHTHGDCSGDFMGTNQSSKGNSDGSTTFYSYTNGAPLYDFTDLEPGAP